MTLRLSSLLVAAAAVCAAACDPHAETVPPAHRVDSAGWVEGLPGLFGVPHVEALAPDLGAIGYAAGTAPAPARSGVVRRADEVDGSDLNLVCSGHAAEARLMDVRGRTLHTWRLPYTELPGAPPLEGPHQIPWRRVTLLEDGGLLAIHEGRALVRMDRRSRLEWYRPLRAHHDLALGAEGEIHVLARGERVVARVHPSVPIVDDRITTLDAHGNVVSELSLWDALLASEWAHLVEELTVRTGDVMHANSLELLVDGDDSREPAFRAGRFLVCLRDVDLVGVVDLREKRFVWMMRGPWRGPHDPTVTDAGNLLVFDNLGNDGSSRLLELDPVTGSEVWRWQGEPAESFASTFCGVAQRLADGGTLVTESCRGRAFQIAADGRIVWEYLNPHRAGDDGEFVAALFEVARVPAAAARRWLH